MSHARFVTIGQRIAVSAMCVTLLAGCGGGLAKPHVLMQPDVPVVLLENSKPVLVAVEDPPESGQLVEFGRVVLQKGQTVIWYDWHPIEE